MVLFPIGRRALRLDRTKAGSFSEARVGFRRRGLRI
jgi:hypothetical protein